MSKKKPFDMDAARDEIDHLEAQASALEYQMEDETEMETRQAYSAMIRRLLKKADKLRLRIMAEEDAQAQAMYKDREPEYEAMMQRNQEAMDRWRAEHGDAACVAEPYNKD